MKAVISSFRRGRHTQTDNQMIVIPENTEKAADLVGKSAVWVSPAKKEIKGKVTALHGRKGALRIHFETGMPGQSLGTTVDIN